MLIPIIIAIENVATRLDHISIFSPPGEDIILRMADASSFIELRNLPKIKLTVLQTKIPRTRKSIYLIWLSYILMLFVPLSSIKKYLTIR